jgi:hypothetical protein
MELLILSIKGDAAAVRFAFFWVTLILLSAALIDLTGSYIRLKNTKKQWSIPNWYIYPFIFWLAFLVFDIYLQNSLKEFNESNNNFEVEKQSISKKPGSDIQNNIEEDTKNCFWCGKPFSGDGYEENYDGNCIGGSNSYVSMCSYECCNKYATGSNQSSNSNSSGNSKQCSWCGKSFSGNGYNYSLGECLSGSSSYFSKCSNKCCSESLKNDPNLSDKWKN